jgi:hypothetical protein
MAGQEPASARCGAMGAARPRVAGCAYGVTGSHKPLESDRSHQLSGLYAEPKGHRADAGFSAGRRRAVCVSQL